MSRCAGFGGGNWWEQRGWLGCLWHLVALPGLSEGELERLRQAESKLSVVEYTVLNALSRQDGWHLRMQQLAPATALSPSATTRLLAEARPVNDATLERALAEAQGIPELAPLVDALPKLHARAA